ncbi:Uncharacterized 50 kDa protein in type I retrotransposable element R1DM [Eumeta japonica]|uniref:Uncharacterized 50 kDa protein in type I retrotransposable element R1DM n=1 Tax=Eumeta variegata TaxID=151549 RepID=A0A4C1XLL6_EUMVA|nr:Uncharacterized 50 kDa protein in type I retrotransposable element R1DM [Eumeta japonica]
MADREESAIFPPRQSLCRTPPSEITILEDLPTGYAAGKRPRESPSEENPAVKPRLETESDEERTAAAPRCSEKEELMRRVHDSVKAISALVAGPGSKLNKADISNVAAYGHEILVVVAALNLRGSEAVATDQPQSYASALRLPGLERAAVRKPESGPVLAIYPVAEQLENVKTAEDTKQLLKNAIDPASMQVQVTKVRKVGRAGVVVQTTSAESANKIRKAVPLTLRVTEPRSRKPRVALRNMLGDPSNEDILTGLYEQNLRVRDPTWTLERLKQACRIAFKKSRRDHPITMVVLECSPELRDLLVSLDRAFIGWEAVPVCDYIDVTCCHKCQQYGHPAEHCRSKDIVCGKCGEVGHKLEDCKATVTRCATCHRFGRRDAETHKTASRECPARKFAKERYVSVTRYGYAWRIACRADQPGMLYGCYT